MSKNRSIRRSESCGHFDQPKYNTLSTNEQINVVEVRDQNVTNSEALSSCESPKGVVESIDLDLALSTAL